MHSHHAGTQQNQSKTIRKTTKQSDKKTNRKQENKNSVINSCYQTTYAITCGLYYTYSYKDVFFIDRSIISQTF